MPFLFLRQYLEQQELDVLPPYAIRNAESRGRAFTETPSQTRLGFQRDRDRVLHSKAFRRLKGKTQVFVAHHGDHFRSRLTHSLEVAQIARSLSRILGGNEDLTEAIALAHDLGHTPFGHAGQEAMRDLMHRFGLTFEHNAQSRRIVEKLETRSIHYHGLNLLWETREGLFKHATPYDKQIHNLSEHSFLEAQIVDFSDEIAYQNHDVDDGLRSGIITLSDLEKLEIWRKASEKVPQDMPQDIWITQVISALINHMVTDLATTTAQRLEALQPSSPDDIRHAPEKVTGFSRDMEQHNNSLRHLLYSKFYKSPKVLSQSTHGQETIKKLFFHFSKHPQNLPQGHQQNITAGETKEVVIKDFIAGMTDAFALEMARSI